MTALVPVALLALPGAVVAAAFRALWNDTGGGAHRLTRRVPRHERRIRLHP